MSFDEQLHHLIDEALKEDIGNGDHSTLSCNPARAKGKAVLKIKRGWLRHHGSSLVERFDANSYLALIDAMDTHDLGSDRGSYERVLNRLGQPVLVGSITSDALYVAVDQQDLAFLLPRGEFLEIDSEHGHDGFLIDAAGFEPQVRRFVEGLEDAAREGCPWPVPASTNHVVSGSAAGEWIFGIDKPEDASWQR